MRPTHLSVLLAAVFIAGIASCTVGPAASDGSTLTTSAGQGAKLVVEFKRGKAWMHEAKLGIMKLRITPQMALWAQDRSGAVTTLFVTRAFAKQDWKFAKIDPDSCGRPTCMPYWLNRLRLQGLPLPTKNSPLPDAITGATPPGSFTLTTALPVELRRFTLFVEINKSFDNNDAWPASKKDMSSFNGQPPLIYKAEIDLDDSTTTTWTLLLAGMSGETGVDSTLYPIDSRLSTALDMLQSITVRR